MGSEYTIEHGAHFASVMEVGAALRMYRAGDQEYVETFDAQSAPIGGHGQLLMPWPNRVRDGRYDFGGNQHQLALTEPARHNAIHGLVRWANWTVSEHESNRLVLSHRLHAQPGYPFVLDFTVEYALGDSGLSVHHMVRNVGSEPCPFGAGAHPYVAVGCSIDDAILTVPASQSLEIDDHCIPTGTTPVEGTALDYRKGRPLGATVLDHAFTELHFAGDGRARARLAAPGGTAVDVWMDTAHDHVMIFTGSAGGGPRNWKGVAIEPMTCAPNALADGTARVLTPDEEFRWAWGISPVSIS